MDATAVRRRVTTVVVTMAGESRRFREAGFTSPKYRLRVGERTIFSWALDSLRWYAENGARFVLVGRADDVGLDRFVAAECQALGYPAPELIQLGHSTAGQAETVLAARARASASTPLVIYNIDTHVRPGVLAAATLTGDGCIPCFPGTGDGWSFVACDAQGRATSVREKQRISPHCSVGLYAFRDFATYELAYRATPAGATERYVAPLYNALIARGLDIRMEPIAGDEVVPLGTPAEAAAVGELRTV